MGHLICQTVQARTDGCLSSMIIDIKYGYGLASFERVSCVHLQINNAYLLGPW